MTDDKYNPTDQYWYKKRWEISFSNADSTWSYFIFSDSPASLPPYSYDGNPGANSIYTDVEVAVNPVDKHLYMIGVPYASFDNSATSRLTSKLNLKKTYGIEDIRISGGTGSNSKRILFDHLGRPYRGTNKSLISPQDHLATTAIYIKLCRETSCTKPYIKENNSDEIVIRIEPETGYVHIL